MNLFLFFSITVWKYLKLEISTSSFKYFQTVMAKKPKFVRSVFGRIYGAPICFWFYLTFRSDFQAQYPSWNHGYLKMKYWQQTWNSTSISKVSQCSVPNFNLRIAFSSWLMSWWASSSSNWICRKPFLRLTFFPEPMTLCCTYPGGQHSERDEEN